MGSGIDMPPLRQCRAMDQRSNMPSSAGDASDPSTATRPQSIAGYPSTSGILATQARGQGPAVEDSVDAQLLLDENPGVDARVVDVAVDPLPWGPQGDAAVGWGCGLKTADASPCCEFDVR